MTQLSGGFSHSTLVRNPAIAGLDMEIHGANPEMGSISQKHVPLYLAGTLLWIFSDVPAKRLQGVENSGCLAGP